MPGKKPTSMKVRKPKSVVSDRLSATHTRRYENAGAIKKLISEKARSSPIEKRNTAVLKDIIKGFKKEGGYDFRNSIRSMEALVNKFEKLNTLNKNRLERLNRSGRIEALSKGTGKSKPISILPGSGRTIPSHKYIKNLEKAYTGEMLKLLKKSGFKDDYVRYGNEFHEKHFVVGQKTLVYQRELESYLKKFELKAGKK